MERETNSDFLFPPGFRFHPSDEELIIHYLLNKLKSNPLPADVVAEIELYNFNPWELPKKALFGEDEWFFFSPRDRKYPNGERPNRTASSGYWKATGTDKPILSPGSKKIGVKKALVFYTGRAPRGIKTNWIMSEYRLPDTSRSSKLKGSMRLDDWVLCRVRQKGNMSKNTWEDQGSPNKGPIGYLPKIQELSPTNTYVNTNIMAELQTRGCQALSTMFSVQYIPQVEAPVYEDGTYNADSLFNNIFDMPKVKFSEGGVQRNITSNEDNLEFYDRDQYARDDYNICPLNAIASLQGPNETTKISRTLEQAFTERQQI